MRPAFIEQGAALQADPTCEADLGPLLDALRDLKLVLEALRDHDFSISLAPAGALLRPGERATFTATLTPRGLLPAATAARWAMPSSRPRRVRWLPPGSTGAWCLATVSP
jgi:hypothetical protein